MVDARRHMRDQSLAAGWTKEYRKRHSNPSYTKNCVCLVRIFEQGRGLDDLMTLLGLTDEEGAYAVDEMRKWVSTTPEVTYNTDGPRH